MPRIKNVNISFGENLVTPQHGILGLVQLRMELRQKHICISRYFNNWYNCKINYTIAANSLPEDFYFDDFMTGSTDVQNTLLPQHQLVQLIGKAQINIRKFTSNSKKVLQALRKDLVENKFISFDKEEGVKALRIFWNPVEDHFAFHTATMTGSTPIKYTKRHILSEIWKFIDLLG